VGTRPEGRRTEHDPRQVVAAVQREVLPYDKNYLRRGSVLTESLTTLDALWAEIRDSLGGDGAERVRTRQAAAMTAHARWMYRAALARTETRGMAKRLDFPDQDPDQHHRLITGGLDRIWVRPEQATIPAAVAS
jgi:succinate dehydrogenase/fumarate reductase flavoprotein subunit